MIPVNNLDEYMARYGHLLGLSAGAKLTPLHTPGVTERVQLDDLLRTPFPAQHDFISGIVAAMRVNKSNLVCGEMGTGKTLCAMAAVHAHAAGKEYNAVAMVPNQLVQKWKRELHETLPGVKVTVVEDCDLLARIARKRAAGTLKGGQHWFIIARDRVKAAAKWRGQAAWAGKVKKPGVTCPGCGSMLTDKDDLPVKPALLDTKKVFCEGVKRKFVGPKMKLVEKVCGEPMWAFFGKQQDRAAFDRFEPAKFIKEKMRGFFRYLVIDEAHETKSAESNQAVASGALIASVRHVLALTGTLIGGYANHIRPMLIRMCPRSLIREGLGWNNPSAFDERYGVIETMTTEKEAEVRESGRHGRGKTSCRSTKTVKPGIVPTLFGRHLLGNSVYLGLSEISDRLPELREIVVPVKMEQEQAVEYKRISDMLRSVNAELLLKNDKSLLGAMLQTLLAWPDYPFDWEDVGYWMKYTDPVTGEKHRRFIPVVKPASYPTDFIGPKEEELLNILKAEKEQGRQAWVFVQFTDKRDVQTRLFNLIRAAGLSCKELRASVPPAKREEWIAKHGPGTDVIISFPKLVETGLDLFDKKGRHNFPSLIFYETGYNLFTLRQASRRAWRIGQKKQCRVYYMYYEGTMQAVAMALMGRKMIAAEQLEGKFSSDGLAAMGGDDGSIQMALAKSLDNYLPGDTDRTWAKIADVGVDFTDGGDDAKFDDDGLPPVEYPDDEDGYDHEPTLFTEVEAAATETYNAMTGEESPEVDDLIAKLMSSIS